jgi:hypothetical protein
MNDNASDPCDIPRVMYTSEKLFDSRWAVAALPPCREGKGAQAGCGSRSCSYGDAWRHAGDGARDGTRRLRLWHAPPHGAAGGPRGAGPPEQPPLCGGLAPGDQQPHALFALQPVSGPGALVEVPYAGMYFSRGLLTVSCGGLHLQRLAVVFRTNPSMCHEVSCLLSIACLHPGARSMELPACVRQPLPVVAFSWT